MADHGADASAKGRFGSAEVAADVRRRIIGGELQTHERLPAERALADRYAVSRGTVREALTRLGRENLVEIRPGSGTYVIYAGEPNDVEAIQSARPLELMDARFALEPHICRLAVLHARRDDFDRLETLAAEMEKSLEDPAAFSEADTAFHSGLVESTGNNLLVWMIAQIKSVRGQHEWQRMRELTLNPEMIATYNAQHRRILDAIRDREPEAAAQVMKEHLETARLSLTRAADT